MEDEYKVVCALSDGAVFDDLEWPQTKPGLQFQGHSHRRRSSVNFS